MSGKAIDWLDPDLGQLARMPMQWARAALEFHMVYKAAHPTAVEVPPWRQRYAEGIAAWAAEELGLVEPPTTKWFSRAAEMSPSAGMMLPGASGAEIWCAVEAPDEVLALIVTHECVHAAKMVQGLPDLEAETLQQGERLLAEWDAHEAGEARPLVHPDVAHPQPAACTFRAIRTGGY